MREIQIRIDAGDPNSPLDPDGTISDLGAFYFDQGEYSPAPQILSVKDVLLDQGGKVTIKWRASSLDTNINTLPFYSVWRALPEGVQTQSSILSAKDITLKSERTAYRVVMFNSKNYSWEWLANQPAHRFHFYTYTAATLYDSMSTTDGKHYFLVSAHTYDPNVFYDSMPDSSYSVDNLAPIAPRNLAARYDSGTVVLHWNPVTATDLRQYLIYRNSSPNINPDILPHFATSKDTMFLDASPLSGTSYYVIRAQDIHDNRSLKSNEVAVIVTRVNEPKGKIPTAYMLYQNYPNPFNPSTTISYAIPMTSYVTLKVYNFLGKEVERLVSEKQSAGEYEIKWNPVDLPSGVYVYRLEVGTFVATRKLILIK